MGSVYREAVISMARAGASPAQIAESLGCCKQTVYSNWPPNVPTPHMVAKAGQGAEDFDTVVTLSQKGWSQAKIASKLKINISRVQRMISRYNSALESSNSDPAVPGASPSPPSPVRPVDDRPGHL